MGGDDNEDDTARRGRVTGQRPHLRGGAMKQFAALSRRWMPPPPSRPSWPRWWPTCAWPPGDAAWAVYFLAGGKPRQMVPTKRLKALAQQAAGLPEWLFDESYEAVGDLAETIALLLPPPAEPADVPLAEWMAQLLPLRACRR